MLPSLYLRSAFLVAIVSGFQPSILLHHSPNIFQRLPNQPASLHLKMSQGSLSSGPFPDLCVLDLDACFWDQEMYTLSYIPDTTNVVKGDLNGRGEGVKSVMSGRTRISLHKGSLMALQAHYDGRYPNMKVSNCPDEFSFELFVQLFWYFDWYMPHSIALY